MQGRLDMIYISGASLSVSTLFFFPGFLMCVRFLICLARSIMRRLRSRVDLGGYPAGKGWSGRVRYV